jgi:hypothetical protein
MPRAVGVPSMDRPGRVERVLFFVGATETRGFGEELVGLFLSTRTVVGHPEDVEGVGALGPRLGIVTSVHSSMARACM